MARRRFPGPGRMRLGAMAAAVLVGGCGAPPPPEAPVPVEIPLPRVQEPAHRVNHGWQPPSRPVTDDPDPILSSRWAFHPEIRDATAEWIHRFTETERPWFNSYLSRMARYAPLVDSLLLESGAPASLRYLPIVESGYSPSAVSRASAAGMWQFMAPVARSFGMRVDAVVDERRDPPLATAAALQYLTELEARFDSWFLALAAYNGGPSRVSRLLRKHAPLSPLGDSLFLVIRPHLPRETRDFIPKFLAAATLGGAPHHFGLVPDRELPPLAFDTVTVPDATTLDVVAAAAGATEEEIQELNPHLVRAITPRGRATALRVPPGRGDAFRVAYALIPPDQRVTVTEHVVAAGETLSEIAQLYGIRTAELEAANPRVRPRTLQIGTRLVVPLVPRGGS